MRELKHLLGLTEKALAKYLVNALGKQGYKVQKRKSFIYGPGTIPVLLVAHIDTVHSCKPQQIFHDKEVAVLWSPDGLGADDRAGVWAILQLLRRGHRPHILFTDGEEVGGIGADDAADMLDAPDVKYIIQLDRRGAHDAVYYGCDSKDFEAYITKHGFSTASGSFSDISILCPAWGIAGVNLSVGYYNEHGSAEYLMLPELRSTVDAVSSLLDTAKEAPYFKFMLGHTAMRLYGKGWYDPCDYFPQTLPTIADSYGNKWDAWLVETIADEADYSLGVYDFVSDDGVLGVVALALTQEETTDRVAIQQLLDAEATKEIQNYATYRK